MSLSALARSPECEQLLKFHVDHDISDNWESPSIDCFVNGHELSGDIEVGDSTNQELIVHVHHKDSKDKCNVHLSTLIALATAHIKYQYEAVVEALSNRGQPTNWALKGEPEGVSGRVMVYANLVAKHGHDSLEAKMYYDKNRNDDLFINDASTIRVKARILDIVNDEESIRLKAKEGAAEEAAEPNL